MNFFKHSCNAFSTPTIRYIKEEYGWAGIGFYWTVMEHLYLNGGHYPQNTIMSWIARGLKSNKKLQFLSDEKLDAFIIDENREVWLKSSYLTDRNLPRAHMHHDVGTDAGTITGTDAGADADADDPTRAGTIFHSFKKKRVERDAPAHAFEKMMAAARNAEERNFYTQMKQNYPRVCQMDQPLSYAELHKLLNRGFSPEQINATLKEMENFRHLQLKYVSTYLTLLKWMASDKTR